jgi:hypothetical protein
MWTVLVDIGVMPGHNRAAASDIPADAAGQPWRIQLSAGSDSGGADCSGWCWQSHHVPPGQSS